MSDLKNCDTCLYEHLKVAEEPCDTCRVMPGGEGYSNWNPKQPAGIDATLSERGNRYGEFKDQAVYAQGMADIARSSPNWPTMAPDQKEGLSIIFNKIGRILNGDPDYSDSWHDIAGYATLVDKRLKAEGK